MWPSIYKSTTIIMVEWFQIGDFGIDRLSILRLFLYWLESYLTKTTFFRLNTFTSMCLSVWLRRQNVYQKLKTFDNSCFAKTKSHHFSVVHLRGKNVQVGQLWKFNICKARRINGFFLTLVNKLSKFL